METYLIRGALVVDGSGAPPFEADVLVADGRIAAVGTKIDGGGATVIDAGCLALAPGFIDIHSHSDMTLIDCPLAESKLFQGVTSEATGNCGLSLFPVKPGGEGELADYLKLHDFALPKEGICWNDFASWAERIKGTGLGPNIAPLVGHAPLRIAAMGMDDRPPAPEELERMGRLLEETLSQGAWGMSTGLIYPPGSYAATGELVALARALAAHDALYASHIRNEGEGLTAALDEAIAIGRESGARVQVSHLKAMGRGNRGRGKEAAAKLAAARSAGIDVAADQYPYAASATTLSAVVPQWAHASGVSALFERLRNPEIRHGLEAEIERQVAAREGAEGIVVTPGRSSRNGHLSGWSLARIAAEWGSSPAAAVVRLILDEANVGAVFFSMSEEDVAAIMADSMVAVGSDGHGLNAEQSAGEATHPRSYGTFPRVLARYMREQGVLTLGEAVRKMTSLPASRLGMADRGLVRPGFAADLVLFDPATIIDTATFADPHRYATGVVHLFINGSPVIREGKLTGNRPGRVLRRGSNAIG